MTTKETASQRIDRAITETAEALSDGLDLKDIGVLIRNGIEVADELDELTGEEKKELAKRYVAELLDQGLAAITPELEKCIEALDIPFLPEALERITVDPLLCKVLPSLLRPIIKDAVPGLVDVIVNASKGSVRVNSVMWADMNALLGLIPHIGTISEVLKRQHGWLHGSGAPEDAEKSDAIEAAIDAIADTGI